MFLTGFYTNSSRIYISQMIFCCDSFILSKIHMYTYTMTAILNFKIYRNFLAKKGSGDFSGDPVVRTWCFHCREPSVDPWLGNWDPKSHTVWPNNRKRKYIEMCQFVLSRPHSSKVLIYEILDKIQKTKFCGWSQKHYSNERKDESSF